MPSSIVNIKPKFTKLSRLAKFDLLCQKMLPTFASFLFNNIHEIISEFWLVDKYSIYSKKVEIVLEKVEIVQYNFKW